MTRERLINFGNSKFLRCLINHERLYKATESGCGKKSEREGLSHRQHLFVALLCGMLLGLYIISLFSALIQLDTDLFLGIFKTLLVSYPTLLTNRVQILLKYLRVRKVLCSRNVSSALGDEHIESKSVM